MKLLFRTAAVTVGIVIATVMMAYFNPRQIDLVCDATQDRICQRGFIQLDRVNKRLIREAND